MKTIEMFEMNVLSIPVFRGFILLGEDIAFVKQFLSELSIPVFRGFILLGIRGILERA